MYTLLKQIAEKNKYAYSIMHGCHSNKFRYANQKETKPFAKILIDKICNKIINK